jgi:hypothetical protein
MRTVFRYKPSNEGKNPLMSGEIAEAILLVFDRSFPLKT